MSTLTESLREAAADALLGYRALVADCAVGVEVTPEEAIDIARAAGRTAQQLADDIELASQRAEAQAEFDARDFDQELATATAEYKARPALMAAAITELEAAQERVRALREQERVLIAKREGIARQAKAAREKYNATMATTCQVERNPGEPCNFKLAK